MVSLPKPFLSMQFPDAGNKLPQGKILRSKYAGLLPIFLANFRNLAGVMHNRAPSSRDIWQCPGTIPYLGIRGCYWHLQVEKAKDILLHPTVNRTPLNRNKISNQHVSSARLRNALLMGRENDHRSVIRIVQDVYHETYWNLETDTHSARGLTHHGHSMNTLLPVFK